MTSFLIALPSIYVPFTELCVEGMADDVRDRVQVIDNTGTNLGVAASWNTVGRRVRDEGLDWLIVCSAATRFGPTGARDFIDQLDALPDAWVVEPGISAAGRLPVVGWHFLAWSRHVLDRVGLFDENFWPAYGEDMDISRRVLLASREDHPGPDFWVKITIDAELELAGHGVKLAGIVPDIPLLWSYYERKWGGPFGREWFKRPFGDPAAGLDWWPTSPDCRSIVDHHQRP